MKRFADKIIKWIQGFKSISEIEHTIITGTHDCDDCR